GSLGELDRTYEACIAQETCDDVENQKQAIEELQEDLEDLRTVARSSISLVYNAATFGLRGVGSIAYKVIRYAFDPDSWLPRLKELFVTMPVEGKVRQDNQEQK
ncbi:MAG TPA: hypothetical protein VLV83_01815, partial [Acidobacteriota bacterium]|nr:hypothetical protein [Acidobacteriota bacterium]